MQTAQSHSRSWHYPVVVVGCIAHAVIFPITVWYMAVHGGWGRLDVDYWFSWIFATLSPKVVVIAILVTWPLWVFPLVLCRDGRKSKVIVPLILGFVALCAGCFLLFLNAVLNSALR